MEQTDENGLSVLSLATLQGVSFVEALHSLLVQFLFFAWCKLIANFNKGNMKMVQWIVENFASVGLIPDSKGNYPIHFAAAAGK